VYAVIASGSYVPAMLIYPRAKMKGTVSYRAPPGTVFSCQYKRWMDSEVFCECNRYFSSVVKPMPQEKVLLISDGHISHNLGLATIEIPRKHGVVMLSLPPHSNSASRCHKF
jgi:hypothetical protein